MFKKVIVVMVVMIMAIGGAVGVNALCMSEEGRPGIVGAEHIDTILEIEERWNEDDRDVDYDITMTQAEGYWIVLMEGFADEYYGYSAMGIYDHFPAEEEINILWANRMLEDELYDLMDEYGC